MWCNTCEQHPCICRGELVVATQWLVRDCPICQRVKIRERAGQQTMESCKWCQSATPQCSSNAQNGSE